MDKKRQYQVRISEKLVSDVLDEHFGEQDIENNEGNLEWELKKLPDGSYPISGVARKRAY